jgi:MoxR-like ATPase
MLVDFVLTGTIKEDGALHLHHIPTELEDMLPDKTYNHAAFLEIPSNTTITFSVVFNTRNKSLNMLEDSVSITTHDKDTIEGWACISGVWFSPEEQEAFEICSAIAAEKSAHFINILIGGPSGYGKTTRAQAWAEHMGVDFVRLNVALLRHEQAIFGVAGITGNNGTTKTAFTPTEAAEAMQKGNVVILIDEVNRAAPNVLNGIFSLLDDARKVMLNTPDGNFAITVGPNTLFVATANMGYQYVGTWEMDSALRKRFGLFLEVGPLPLDVEVALLQDRFELDADIAEAIVLALDGLRGDEDLSDADIDITTRKSIQLAQLIKKGMPAHTAFKIGLINGIPRHLQKHVTDRIREIGI